MSTPSPIDFSNYYPPGVYTNPTATPVLAVNNALPTAVGLFGLTVGYRNYTESILINPDTNDTTPAINATLTQKGINTSTIVVTNLQTGQIYTYGTDYTYPVVVGPSGTNTATYTISRVISGHINQSQTVQVSYQYTDSNYFNPQIFYTYNDIVTAYGAPYVTTGTNAGVLQSELTLGAKFAFLNGAYQLVCVAVNPANPSAPNVGDYYNALQLFNDQALIAVVVCCNGTYQALQQDIQIHVDQQSAHRFERRAIIGMDGTVTRVNTSQRMNNANNLYDERIAMVSPDVFDYYSTELNAPRTLGGQFVACALAGMTVNQVFAQPLTHKIITGFTGVDPVAVIPDGAKSLESQNGLMVVEMAPPNGQRMWVRHGVTTNSSDIFHREWSIIGQQDAMIYTLRAYLLASNLIGQPIYDYTLINVKAAVEAGLQSLVVNSQIDGYNSLSVRQLITNPDVLEVSFNWKPAFPLNYIVLTFGVDLTSGDIATVGASPNTSDFTNSQNVNVATTGVSTGPSTSAINDFGGSSNTLRSD